MVANLSNVLWAGTWDSRFRSLISRFSQCIILVFKVFNSFLDIAMFVFWSDFKQFFSSKYLNEINHTKLSYGDFSRDVIDCLVITM